VFITELEINNFKSFSGITKIPFFEGFAVISGPNGSGKSNIIDSILFVLALAGSSSLRAEKLTDLINLNNNRNYAEVSAAFSDGTKIRRRIKRAAHGYYSYYYLNDRVTTQSELLDYLSRFGIKPEGYNVVMQGDITRIMEMSDNERRRIIDEIAGVSEFENKKEQALQELEVVRERIEREEIVLRELQSRLEELTAERERAVDYRTLQDEIGRLERSRMTAALRGKERELEALLQVMEEKNRELEKVQAQRAKREQELLSRQEILAGIEAQINEKSGPEYMGLVASLEEKKGIIKAARQGIERSKKEKEENGETLNRIYMDLKRAEERVRECTEQVRTLSIDRANLSMEIAGRKAEIERIEGEISRHGKEVEGAKEEILSLMKEIDERKEARTSLLRDQDILIERSRLRTSEIERLETLIQRNAEEKEEKSRTCSDCRGLVRETEARKDALDRELAALESRLFASRSALERAREEVKNRQAELARLEAQQQARGEGESRALEAVSGMDGVHGTIAALGKAPKDYATALNVAAGGRLGYVVVDNDIIAAQAITYLKENRLGRLTFLPLSRLRPPTFPPLREKGIVDYAVNLLEYDPRFDSAFRVVFGTTVIVETLDQARNLMGKYRMATLEGELLEKSGVMTGGYLKKSRGFGIAAGEDIARVRQILADAETEVADQEEIIRALTAEVDKKRENRSAIIDEMTRNRAMAEEAEKRVQALEEEGGTLQANLSTLQAEVQGGADQLADLESRMGAVNDELARLNGTLEEKKRALDDSRIPALMERVEKQKQEFGEEERRLRNKESDITDAQRERQYFTKRVEELGEDRTRVQEKNASLDTEVASLEEQISQATSDIKDLEGRLKEFSSDLEKLRAERDQALDSVRAGERSIGDAESGMERVRLQITALQDRENGLRGEIESLRGSAGESEETELTIEQIESRLKEAQESLLAMGAVNMLAIEEYERVKGRVDERTEKKETLSRERTTLIERIEKFEEMKYNAFMTAFREIDTNFREIFARLTSGNGHLVLLNEEDPFKGGLTFAVQPQEKKVHLLSALSGGEKSIVTLSFIFAIQKYMPAPFYAMDEIDMFLDGSNVERIAAMIKELSGNAQSIIVSLRKPMIEKADRILGVTLRPDKSTLVTGVKANG
jgi:chromosome segregation protein